MSPPWVDNPTVALDLDRAPAERISSIPSELLAEAHTLVESMQADAKLVPPGVAEAAAARTLGKYNAEAKAWGKVLDQSWKRIILANISYDLIINFFACSGVLIESDRGPVLARNMDFWPERELARTSMLFRYEQSGKPKFWIAGWPGSIGVVSGMSANGFAITLNAVSSSDRPGPTGYPTMLWIREVLERASGFEEALEKLRKKPLLSACLLGLAGTKNDQRVIVERTPNRAELRWGEPGQPLIVTNDYRKLIDGEGGTIEQLRSTACGRFDALTSFFGSNPPGADSDEALIFALSEPTVLQGITAQQMVFRPNEQRVRLTSPRRVFEEPL